MAENADKPANRKRRNISPILTSAFVLSVLTAMFFLQGRAYRQGWLSRFGLDSAQFPISMADTYWLALNGWANIAVGWFNNAWDIYLGYLPILILPLALFAFATFAWEWHKANRKREIAQREPVEDPPTPTSDEPQKWLAASDWKAWSLRGAISLVVAPVSLAVLPLLLFLVGWLLAFLVAVVVAPFQNTGKEAASTFCKRPIAYSAKIVMVDGASYPEWGYQIECNPDVCAMIRDGKVYVVPASNVERIELPSFGNAPEKSDETGQEQLCPVPDNTSAIPA